MEMSSCRRGPAMARPGYGDEPPPPRPSYGRPSYEGRKAAEYEKPSYGRSEGAGALQAWWLWRRRGDDERS
ncbi:hypothetical protein GBA52_025388 [Prunus armeniaca]|nr:hypothetical protein GBA52_025388 [Prunus armeniaca]